MQAGLQLLESASERRRRRKRNCTGLCCLLSGRQQTPGVDRTAGAPSHDCAKFETEQQVKVIGIRNASEIRTGFSLSRARSSAIRPCETS